jgi:hypothetical protein
MADGRRGKRRAMFIEFTQHRHIPIQIVGEIMGLGVSGRQKATRQIITRPITWLSLEENFGQSLRQRMKAGSACTT